MTEFPASERVPRDPNLCSSVINGLEEDLLASVHCVDHRDVQPRMNQYLIRRFLVDFLAHLADIMQLD